MKEKTLWTSADFPELEQTSMLEKDYDELLDNVEVELKDLELDYQPNLFDILDNS